MSRRFLVIGADGMLGGCLFARWQAVGFDAAGTTLLAPDRAGLHQLDFANLARDWKPPLESASAVICAAITNQEQCRRDPAGTRKINVTQTLALARRLVECGCFVTFISSNMVFDGSKPLRSTTEPVSPKTEYGRQKAEVESALSEMGNRTAVVRLTKVIQAGLPIVRGWRKSLAEGRQITPFSDYICSPLLLSAALDTVAAVAERQAPGTWHASSREDVSYADLARMVAQQLGFDQNLVVPSTSPAGLLEHLPSHTTMDAARTTSEFGIQFAPARQVIETCLNDNA